MGDVVQLNRIMNVKIKSRPVAGLRGYIMWLITGCDYEEVRRTSNAVVGARGVKFSSMSPIMSVNGEFEVVGYTINDIPTTLEKEQ